MIKVNSVSEEYKYLAENYPGHQMLKQSLGMFNEQFEPKKGIKNVKSTSKSKR